jgi:hypothetical protein
MEKTFRTAFKAEKLCADCKAPYLTAEDREAHKKRPEYKNCKFNMALRDLQAAQ